MIVTRMMSPARHVFIMSHFRASRQVFWQSTFRTSSLGGKQLPKTSLPMGTPLPGKHFRVLDENTSYKMERYRLGEQIGSGNFAVVREAVDLKTSNRVAVKIMNKAKCGRSACRNEVDVLFKVNKHVKHKRLTPVLDVFEDDVSLYIVLELLSGGELFERVSERGRLPESEVAHIIRKLGYCLEALHRHGILHRDIKLENILLDSAGGSDFKLTDFGFSTQSRPLGEKSSSTSPSSMVSNQTSPSSSTMTGNSTLIRKESMSPQRIVSKGNLAGTLGYAAPEVLQDQSYSPACDVWSMGVVMFVLLAGYAPFPLEDPDGKFESQEERIKAEFKAIEFGRQPDEWRKIMLEEPWPSISPEAKILLSKMLEINPVKRISLKV